MRPMQEGLHIVLAPEILAHLRGVPITNTLITAWLVVVLLSVFAYFATRRLALIPGKGQVVLETLVGGALSYMEETLGDKQLARRFLPLILTIFLFILAANWLGLFPGIGSIGVYHGEGDHQELIPLLHHVSTDLNVTLALAIIAFFAIEMAGIAVLGFLKYGGKFVNLSSPLNFFIGIIELFSEVARLISFSFRLFGNMFAGKVLILVAMAFVPVILPVPLMLFEAFVGFIQAAIFALLTLFFIKIAVAEAEH